MSKQRMLLRARILLPISSPPIADGAVLISGNRVAALGRWRDLSRPAAEPATDLGHVILLPGLVNAHCHLDYTDMAGQPAPKQFPDWIKGLLARKAAASYADYAQAWLRGAAMLLRTGVTTVGDIEAVPELLPDVWSSTPLRVASFLEMTCVRSRRDPAAIVREAAAKIAALRPGRGFAGLSPHALYSTTPDLLRASAELAARHRWRVTMHVAESIDEFEMCVHGRGHLFDWLKSQRDMSDCGDGTPVEQVRRCGLLGENFLAIHANCLQPADIEALAQSQSSVVHCPRSHAYFRHQPFLYNELAAAGVNVCLGTDSLASVAPTRPPGSGTEFIHRNANLRRVQPRRDAIGHPAPGHMQRRARPGPARERWRSGAEQFRRPHHDTAQRKYQGSRVRRGPAPRRRGRFDDRGEMGGGKAGSRLMWIAVEIVLAKK